MSGQTCSVQGLARGVLQHGRPRRVGQGESGRRERLLEGLPRRLLALGQDHPKLHLALVGRAAQAEHPVQVVGLAQGLGLLAEAHDRLVLAPRLGLLGLHRLHHAVREEDSPHQRAQVRVLGQTLDEKGPRPRDGIGRLHHPLLGVSEGEGPEVEGLALLRGLGAVTGGPDPIGQGLEAGFPRQDRFALLLAEGQRQVLEAREIGGGEEALLQRGGALLVPLRGFQDGGAPRFQPLEDLARRDHAPQRGLVEPRRLVLAVAGEEGHGVPVREEPRRGEGGLAGNVLDTCLKPGFEGGGGQREAFGGESNPNPGAGGGPRSRGGDLRRLYSVRPIPPSMPLESGTRLGQFEILSPLGRGGMGEVYRARDSRLSRDVAIKILPEALARDPDRVARFEREARVLASLNHPHIAAVHGFEQGDGHRFLVLELVPGPTLAERLAKGPLDVQEALPLARQMAEALEEAHARGVVHRDLKPANVKITPEGRVKVLDFGLAKALADEKSDATVDDSPTMTRNVDSAGVILGTAGYMSPEQARGQVVDKRADIWAFGCVLYEMLAGRRLFDGASTTDALAAVLTTEPDWTRLPPATPPGVQSLLRRCLQKDKTSRLHDMGDARIELEEAIADSRSGVVPAPRPSPFPAKRLATHALAFVLGGLVGGAAVAFLVPRPQARPAPPPASTSTCRPRACCATTCKVSCPSPFRRTPAALRTLAGPRKAAIRSSSGGWIGSPPSPFRERKMRSSPSSPRTASGWASCPEAGSRRFPWGAGSPS